MEHPLVNIKDCCGSSCWDYY